jgi:hypothetical protein
MRKTNLSLALGVALIGLPTLTQAAPAKVIDPNGTYVLVEVRNPANFKGLGLVVVAGGVTLARYDPVNRDIRGGTRALATALPKKEMLRVTTGPKTKPVAKTKTSRLFLLPIVPDLWVIESANGTSYSLGSLTFSAKQGEIIDLGVVEPHVDLAEGEKEENVNAGSLMKMALNPFARMPAPKKNRLEIRARTAADLPLPKELAGRTLTVPQLSYGATFGNYGGGLVNRIDGRAGRGRTADPVGASGTPAPQ